jgi:prenyltransferase beta subunit
VSCAEAVQKGLDFLVSKQGKEGNWDGKVKGSSITDTAGCALAILACGLADKEEKYKDALAKATQFLMKSVKEDGSVPQKGMETWGVIYTILYLWEIQKKKPSDEILEKLKLLSGRLAKLQRKTGGWTHDFDSKKAGHSYSDIVAATNYAVMAIKALQNVGISMDGELIDKVGDYFTKVFNEDGGFKYCLEFPDWKSDGKRDWKTSERGRTAGAVYSMILLGKKDSEMVKKGVEYIKAEFAKMMVSPLHLGSTFEHSYLSGALLCQAGTSFTMEEFQETFFDEILKSQEANGCFKKFGYKFQGSTNDFVRTSTALLVLQLRKGNLGISKLVKN